MLRANLLFLLVMLGGSAAQAQTTVDRVDIGAKGVFAIETGAASPSANTPTGSVASVSSVRNVAPTTTIEAKVGLEFGFQYVVVGQPSGSNVTLDVVNIYPPAGLAKPGTAEPIKESKYQLTKKVGETNYLGYGFENDWEVVPGTWTFQIWHQNKKLAEQSFMVSKTR